MAIQDDNTILNKGDLKAYHEAIAPMLGGTLLSRTNVSDHYSTDEKIVGVWTDGKPIYQKTVAVGQRMNWQTGGIDRGDLTISSPIDMSVVDTLVDAKVNGAYPSGSKNTGGVAFFYNAAEDTFNFFASDNVYVTNVTLQYTKTTDTAGSGVTTPGAYDINFPNTWPENTEIYFGNGLYGQRFTGTITAAADTRAIVTLDASIINAKLVSQGGYWTDADDGNYPIGSYDAGTNSFYKMACITGGGSNDGIFLNQYSNAARSNSSYDVWVTYTK